MSLQLAFYKFQCSALKQLGRCSPALMATTVRLADQQSSGDTQSKASHEHGIQHGTQGWS